MAYNLDGRAHSEVVYISRLYRLYTTLFSICQLPRAVLFCGLAHVSDKQSW